MTTTAQHTPGPWRFEAGVEDSEGEFYVCHAATVCDATTVCNPSSEADARLIAAAPELLELAHQYVSDLRHPMSDDSRQRRIERALQVIAQATGEPK